MAEQPPETSSATDEHRLWWEREAKELIRGRSIQDAYLDLHMLSLAHLCRVLADSKATRAEKTKIALAMGQKAGALAVARGAPDATKLPAEEPEKKAPLPPPGDPAVAEALALYGVVPTKH